jgi:hypothetical protein
MVATRLSSPKSWHEMLETRAPGDPSRRDGIKRLFSMVKKLTASCPNHDAGCELPIKPYPPGRIAGAVFPGTSCQDFGELSRVATIT